MMHGLDQNGKKQSDVATPNWEKPKKDSVPGNTADIITNCLLSTLAIDMVVHIRRMYVTTSTNKKSDKHERAMAAIKRLVL